MHFWLIFHDDCLLEIHWILYLVQILMLVRSYKFWIFCLVKFSCWSRLSWCYFCMNLEEFLSLNFLEKAFLIDFKVESKFLLPKKWSSDLLPSWMWFLDSKWKVAKKGIQVGFYLVFKSLLARKLKILFSVYWLGFIKFTWFLCFT